MAQRPNKHPDYPFHNYMDISWFVYVKKTYKIGHLEQSTLKLADTEDGLKMGIENVKKLWMALIHRY
jgi:hypothetical protein